MQAAYCNLAGQAALVTGGDSGMALYPAFADNG